MDRIRWGMLSTARIGRVVAGACRDSRFAEFVAVASRDGGRARRFADEEGISLSFGSYEELLDSRAVDAIYIALPVSMHAEWTIKALAAGKDVLCEKPLAAATAQVEACFDAAEKSGRQCFEGLMYRHHPQTQMVRRMVSDGEIGRLTLVRATLSVSVGEADIRRSPALDGGALNDLGCYCVSALRLFAGSPVSIHAEQAVDTAGLDLRLAATLRMGGDVLGQFDVGLDLPRREELELVGTEGRIVVPDPWLCRLPNVELWRDGEMELVTVDPDGLFNLAHDESDAYRIEIDTVSAAILKGGQPTYGRADAVEQARMLEAIRDASRHSAH
jgi:D-xylose 1-dehydrogenase (NADP+, D-xylono-1,5-lactone-forming)